MGASDFFPKEGKVIILSPAVAARAVEQAPEYASRIFTIKGIPENKAYIVDMDEVSKFLEIDVNPFW